MPIKVFTSCCHYHNQASTHHRCPPHRRNNHQLLCQAPIPSSINSTMAAASGSTNPLQTTNERLNCPGCNEPVGDQPVIFAAGRLWYFLKFKRLCFNSSICRHREHFRCSEPKCKRQLDNNYHVGAFGQNKTINTISSHFSWWRRSPSALTATRPNKRHAVQMSLVRDHWRGRRTWHLNGEICERLIFNIPITKGTGIRNASAVRAAVNNSSGVSTTSCKPQFFGILSKFLIFRDDRQYDLGCHWNRRLEMQNRRERIWWREVCQEAAESNQMMELKHRLDGWKYSSQQHGTFLVHSFPL